MQSWNFHAFSQRNFKPQLIENFDSAQPSWELLYLDANGTCLNRSRVSDVAMSGKSESFQLKFQKNGLYFLGHTIQFPYFIEDFHASIRVKSQDSNIFAALEIVLPRSKTPDGSPVTLLLPGGCSLEKQEWQNLKVNAQPKLLESQVRQLRLELNVPIDVSQAYIRRLVLFCHPSGRQSQIWIDDLQVNGIVTIDETLMRENEQNPVFNPKNTLWFFRQSGIVQDDFVGMLAETKTVAIAEENWTKDRNANPKPTIDRRDALSERLIPKELLTVTQTSNPIQMAVGVDNRTEMTQTAGFFETQNTPGVMPSGTFYGSAEDSIISSSAAATIVPSYSGDQPLTPNRTGNGLTNTDPTSMLSAQPDGFQPARQGEFPEYELEDRVNRGRPHDGCRIAAEQKMLWINGNLPLGIRAVEYRGEPLSYLAGMQFNAVWLRQPPTVELLEEAWEIGIWVICPPPENEYLGEFIKYLYSIGMTDDGRGKDGLDLKIMGRMFARNRNPILAWDIGQNLTLASYNQIQQKIELVRNADYNRRIPMICSAENGTRDYSRLVDILLMGRNAILSSLELDEYDAWMKMKNGWARAGTPTWCAIQTQPTASMANQWKLFGTQEIPAATVSGEHLRVQIRTALANECHGLFFTSQSRLDADDAETKYRAAALELINMELLLIDGWLSAGKSATVVRSSNPEINGVLLNTDHARLLLANIVRPFGQYAMGNTNSNHVRFIMPGNFETHQANHIMPGGTRPITPLRKTGGVSIQLDEVNTSTAVFFAMAEPVLRALIPRSRHVELSKRSARLAINLAKMRLEQDGKTIRQFENIRTTTGLPYLPTDRFPIISMTEHDSMLRETKRNIETAESYYRQQDFSSAYLQAERSIAGLQYYERLKWEEATRNVPSHNMIPPAVSFGTLPAYIETIQKMTRMQKGESRLSGGDCEDVALWGQAGWQCLEMETEGITALVSVGNPQAAHSGQGGLLMRLSQTASSASHDVAGTNSVTLASGSTGGETLPLETAPVWATSPPIRVLGGELLCVTGYIKIPQTLQGNADGLMIMDSMGGEPLAIRFNATDGQWRQFACYRKTPDVVPPNASMVVTFALNAVGEVHLDDLEVHAIVPQPADSSHSSSGSAAAQSPPSDSNHWLSIPQWFQ
ncbi:MAG: hypothetical protein LBT05_17005 [Planctomycetaceae bacterium]|nr:hypothetical protein [Planctomycetaceae bacterium]